MRPGSGGSVLSRLRVGPRTRLALLLLVLLGLFLLVADRAPSPERVRALIEPFGAAGPLVFLLAATALHASFVPGPLLAGASGLLFGPVLGTAVTLTGSVISALVELTVGRRAGRAGMDRIGGSRYQALSSWLERHGFAAVVILRLAPVLPDAPVSYAAGLSRVRSWQIAAGTAVGAAPRAFAYTALGGSLANLNSPLAYVAVGVIVVAGLAGAVAIRWQVRRSRDAAAALRELER
ncbi:MAG: Possible membrane protein [uncultured Solirubrobacterales bacterium]|uniref:TVP38/TMEM64 family membrane protein n=1 Tax=uncultured Solirubrobacterales bacterium TaxID=768556 RepID=A0A6J4SKV8_9ACTN|nr:MAG: Possible membrane protein [uncultured Solirubrobacterales bacterium]